MEFPEWIRKKFNVTTSQSWANIILFYSEDERKALDKFFELFAEFIQSHADENIANETNGVNPDIRKRENERSVVL
jgi:hypothetical protein